MSTETPTYHSGIGFTGLLTILFITLRLTHVIAWSWWLVLSPLWIPVTFVFVAIVIIIVTAAVTS